MVIFGSSAAQQKAKEMIEDLVSDSSSQFFNGMKAFFQKILILILKGYLAVVHAVVLMVLFMPVSIINLIITKI